MEGFQACFPGLDDPRTGNACRHDLHDLLLIALCTFLGGGETCVDMAEFAEAKEEFSRGFVGLAGGLPSHDTFSRLFRALDPDPFRACFQAFMSRFAEACQGVVAIDGKVLRRSFDTASAKSPLHMLSAWARSLLDRIAPEGKQAIRSRAEGCEQRLVLGQIATDAKSNEITAVPKLLEMLSLKGCIVTVDALNCQRDIARKIIDQGGGYALALKGNQGTLHAGVSLFLDDPKAGQILCHRSVDGDHGRIETRVTAVATDTGWLQENHQWPGLKAIGKIKRARETAAKTTPETAYYLLSIPLSPERFGEVVRAHWGVENRLHWVLDVVMNEDQARNRLANGPQNLAVLRHMALNLITNEKSKISKRRKFNRAGWNNAFLAKLIAQF